MITDDVRDILGVARPHGAESAAAKLESIMSPKTQKLKDPLKKRKKKPGIIFLLSIRNKRDMYHKLDENTYNSSFF